MKRVIIASFVGTLIMACEPDGSEPSKPPGTLEFEHPYARIHRQGRRVDIVLTRDEGERRECGLLSERAYAELEDTRGALDPGVDYGYDSETDECTSPPGAWVHVEGFEHSPFLCDFQCCHRELVRAALIYSLAENYFIGGGTLEIDGEPYVAIEPDQRCP